MKTALRVLLALLSILLAAAVAAAGAASAAVYTVRTTLSPEFAAETADNLDYASVRLPDGFGGFTTILDELNGELGYYGLEFTPESLNEFIRTLSLDTIFKEYLLGFRDWLFEYGPKPYLDPEEAARTVVGGLDSQLMGFLSFFMDPDTLVADSIARFADTTSLSRRLDALDVYRPYLSEDALRLSLAAAAFLALLLLVTRRLKLFPALTLTGLALAVSGGVLALAPRLLAAQKNALLADLAMPESTLDIVYLPLMRRTVQNGRVLLAAALALAAISGLLWFVTAQVRRAKAAAKASAARREADGFPVPYPGAEGAPAAGTQAAGAPEPEIEESGGGPLPR